MVLTGSWKHGHRRLLLVKLKSSTLRVIPCYVNLIKKAFAHFLHLTGNCIYSIGTIQSYFDCIFRVKGEICSGGPFYLYPTDTEECNIILNSSKYPRFSRQIHIPSFSQVSTPRKKSSIDGIHSLDQRK